MNAVRRRPVVFSVGMSPHESAMNRQFGIDNDDDGDIGGDGQGSPMGAMTASYGCDTPYGVVSVPQLETLPGLYWEARCDGTGGDSR